MERRLAAILAADVVGYSRLMEMDEAGTLSALKAARSELTDPEIAAHRGRIVKLMGDGVLIEFSSVVDAVTCAVAIQKGVTERNIDVPADRSIVFRIGINLGDVMIDGEDVYGDGVNVAARLEGLAEPGGVCISRTVFDHIDSKLDVVFTDAGEHRVKNISRPVHVFRWSTGRPDPPPSERGASDSDLLPDKPSIAILPFVNMSRDPDQEYFSDGVTEDLITELSRFKELRVVSRNSSFVFKNQSVPVSEIAEKLGTHYLVEGSIRKAGNRLRITAQLVDARRDKHIWAERYDRDLEDIFEVQDDVVRRIAGTLVGRLEHERQERTKRQPGRNLEVYDIYLRGREHFFDWSPDQNEKAAELLKAAVKVEPEYAAALALLSETYIRAWWTGWSLTPETDLSEGYKLATRAVELDEEDSRTHTALAIACLYIGALDKAKHHFETALRLNPNDSRVLVSYSRYAVFAGDPATAVALAHQALQLNPFGKYNWNLGLAKFADHDYDEAVELLRNVRNPTIGVLAVLAASFSMAGCLDSAKSTSEQFLQIANSTPMLASIKDPMDWREFFAARWPFHHRGELEHLLGALQKAGMPV